MTHFRAFASARSPRARVLAFALYQVGPPPVEDDDAEHFSGFYRRRILPGVGHNIPQEAPQATLDALLELLGEKRSR